MRVLHGPVNIGNQPWVLSRYERHFGIRSEVVAKNRNWLKYGADRFLHDSDKKSFGGLLRQSWFALTSPLRYDILHYYFGSSYLSSNDTNPSSHHWFLDLRLAKCLGRKVFMTLQGCDARSSAKSDKRNEITMCRPGACGLVSQCRSWRDNHRDELIKRIVPICDRVFILNPDLAHEIPEAVFLPYASVDVENLLPQYPKTHGPITILHAPTDRGVKGSSFLLGAIENLKRRWPINLLLVNGLPHCEAMPLYMQADLVIDQLLAGWYGGFAVELMAMGKPVGCYLREDDLGCVPSEMRAELPLLRLTPYTLERDLERALRRRDQWPEWGRQSRRFVFRWHHPRTIAASMSKAYRDPCSHFELNVASTVDAA